jgi:hypothetical protein
MAACKKLLRNANFPSDKIDLFVIKHIEKIQMKVQFYE